MALSASQTKEVQSAVQSALEQRQRNEELKRKKREEDDRKAREEEAKLRQKRFEDQKKQQELEAKREADQARREAEQTRREEEARNALLYGPKKAKQQGPKWPTSHSGIKDEVRRRRVGEEEEDSRAGSPAMALTREEKRQRRMEADMRRTYQLKRGSSMGYNKAGRRLPGGAIDAQSAPTSDSGASAQSVKARLAALPNTLTKLNVNKRDTRTIDEILQDRAKAKNVTLDGDDAREFNDWFGKAKKKEPASFPGTQSSASLASDSSSGGNSPRQGGTSECSFRRISLGSRYSIVVVTHRGRVAGAFQIADSNCHWQDTTHVCTQVLAISARAEHEAILVDDPQGLVPRRQAFAVQESSPEITRYQISVRTGWCASPTGQGTTQEATTVAFALALTASDEATCV